MANVIFIIAPENFRDEELQIPCKILKKAGHECKTASITKGICKGMLGARVIPDLTIEEINSDEFDAVVVVGGSGSPKLREYDEVLDVLRDFRDKGKIIGAICLAPMVLSKAGILVGKRVTVFRTPQSEDAVKKGGGKLADENVVVDGKLITGNGPGAAEEFGKRLNNLL